MEIALSSPWRGAPWCGRRSIISSTIAASSPFTCACWTYQFPRFTDRLPTSQRRDSDTVQINDVNTMANVKSPRAEWRVAVGAEETSAVFEPAESEEQGIVFVCAHGAG